MSECECEYVCLTRVYFLCIQVNIFILFMVFYVLYKTKSQKMRADTAKRFAVVKLVTYMYICNWFGKTQFRLTTKHHQ